MKYYNDSEKKIISDFEEYIIYRENAGYENEGGDQVEFFLYGDILYNISIPQCLYLLNLNNYQKDFYIFREEFVQITNFFDKIKKISKNMNENNFVQNEIIKNENENVTWEFDVKSDDIFPLDIEEKQEK